MSCGSVRSPGRYDHQSSVGSFATITPYPRQMIITWWMMIPRALLLGRIVTGEVLGGAFYGWLDKHRKAKAHREYFRHKVLHVERMLLRIRSRMAGSLPLSPQLNLRSYLSRRCSIIHL